MPQEKAQADIPYAFIEYTATFKRPIIQAWVPPAPTLTAILNSLDPFGFKFDGVELKMNAEKPSDYTMVFRRTPAGIVFTVGVTKLLITAENLDWGDAEAFIAGASAGIQALREVSKAEFDSQQLAWAAHIQIKDKPRKEITAPLLTSSAYHLLDGEENFQGIILKRGNTLLVIDGSLSYANGLFVRINRQHSGDTTLPQIAEALRADEERLFEVLGLEGIL
jgi:hypothetical protein